MENHIFKKRKKSVKKKHGIINLHILEIRKKGISPFLSRTLIYCSETNHRKKKEKWKNLYLFFPNYFLSYFLILKGTNRGKAYQKGFSPKAHLNHNQYCMQT